MVVRDLVCRLGARATCGHDRGRSARGMDWDGRAPPTCELGRYLAAECMACHRPATGTSAIPNIFGMAETHFIEAIKAYRDKTRPNPVMQNIVSRLTDEEIASLALYFAKTLKP